MSEPPPALQSSKVNRRVVADGGHCEVSCAVRADGTTSPASDLFDQLAANTWADPHADKLPDERQTRHRDRLIALCEALADGNDLPNGSFNALQAGIWELKVDGIRVTFYDTDGTGSYVDTAPEYEDTWDGGRRPVFPMDDLEEHIRLGHCFAKTTQKTTDEDLHQSQQVREEDLAHDR